MGAKFAVMSSNRVEGIWENFPEHATISKSMERHKIFTNLFSVRFVVVY